MQTRFFMELDKLIPKFVWKKIYANRAKKTLAGKENYKAALSTRS